ncbi:MAG: helix-turn-helix domain-containing protein [Chitinophagaceae bacterium]
MYERKMPLKKRSGIDITFFLVGGKWKRDIIACINTGIRRPGEMQKHLAEVSASPRVLRQQLKELEMFSIIYKKVYKVVPPKVEYYLTSIGEELIPLFEMMEEWGVKYEKENVGELIAASY